jgi:glycosyltransferase involved in cell wall biosynthesis
MRIGIDATGIWGIKEGLQTGITSYTIHIIKNLIQQNTKNKYFIYCRNEIPHYLDTLSPSVFFRVLKSRNRKLLQQIKLPITVLLDRLDLLFCPFNSAPVLCPCRSVVTIHDLHPYIVPERFSIVHGTQNHGDKLRSMVNKVYWKNILKVSSKRADRIIAVSHATKRDIENIFYIPTEKIDVVYEGVDKEYFNVYREQKDVDYFREKYNLHGPYLLCVGTHGYKNIEGVIGTFNIVRKNNQDSVRLVIAGHKRNLEDKIFQLVRESGLEEEIIFTGFFPEEDLKYLYQCAELFLFPSFYEGFGLPVLEAFACGTPVVTSRTGSLPEVAGEAGLLVDPNDAEQIASSVLKLLTNRCFKDKKRQEGLKQIEKFSWEEAGRKTLEIFEKVMSER